MSRIYLCRHGDALSADDADDQLFSVGDHRLSPRGVSQAEALRDALAGADLGAVIASPLRRTLHTAEVVAEAHGLKVEVEPRLVELAFGPRDGPRTYAGVLGAIRDFAIALAQGGDPALGNGETYTQVRRRLVAAVEDAADAHDAAALVAHGAANRVVIAHLLGADAGRVFALEQDPGCVNVLERRGDRWRVLRVNHAPWRAPGSLG